MLEEGCTAGESIHALFKQQGFSTTFSMQEALPKALLDDYARRDCGLSSFSQFFHHPTVMGDLKIGERVHTRGGVKWVVDCIDRKFKDAIYIWPVRSPWNWISCISSFVPGMESEDQCESFVKGFKANWVAGLCGKWDWLKALRSKASSDRVAIFALEDMSFELLQKFLELQQISVSPPLPHVGQHSSTQRSRWFPHQSKYEHNISRVAERVCDSGEPLESVYGAFNHACVRKPEKMGMNATAGHEDSRSFWQLVLQND